MFVCDARMWYAWYAVCVCSVCCMWYHHPANSYNRQEPVRVGIPVDPSREKISNRSECNLFFCIPAGCCHDDGLPASVPLVFVISSLCMTGRSVVDMHVPKITTVFGYVAARQEKKTKLSSSRRLCDNESKAVNLPSRVAITIINTQS